MHAKRDSDVLGTILQIEFLLIKALNTHYPRHRLENNQGFDVSMHKYEM